MDEFYRGDARVAMRCYAGGLDFPGNTKFFQERLSMSAGFWPVVIIVLFVIVWVLAKVLVYARRSEEQWQRVDKSKLKAWDDDEDP